MEEIRELVVIQDNLLLCYELSKSVNTIRNIDNIFISKFLSSLNINELTMLWTSNITSDFTSDLDLCLSLCEWILPIIEDMELYETCSLIMRVKKDCELLLKNFPE